MERWVRRLSLDDKDDSSRGNRTGEKETDDDLATLKGVGHGRAQCAKLPQGRKASLHGRAGRMRRVSTVQAFLSRVSRAEGLPETLRNSLRRRSQQDDAASQSQADLEAMTVSPRLQPVSV